MNRFKDIKLAVSIAYTHLRARLKQTVIATIGVTFGITVFIFMVSFITGQNQYFQQVAFDQTAHIRLYNEAQIAEKTVLDQKNPQALNIVHHVKPKDIRLNLKDGRQVVQELQNGLRVNTVSGSLNTQVFYRFGSSSINGMVNGIEFERENALFDLQNKLVEGSFQELSTMPNSLVMGVGLARRLNVRTGDRLNVTTEDGANYFVNIVGLFKTGLTDVDRQQSFADIKTVQRFMRVPASLITDIKLKISGMDAAPGMSDELQNRYGFQGSNWQIDNAAFLEGEILRNIITYGV